MISTDYQYLDNWHPIFFTFESTANYLNEKSFTLLLYIFI